MHVHKIRYTCTLRNNNLKNKNDTYITKCFPSPWSINIKTCMKFLSILLNSKKGFYFVWQALPYIGVYNRIGKNRFREEDVLQRFGDRIMSRAKANMMTRRIAYCIYIYRVGQKKVRQFDSP